MGSANRMCLRVSRSRVTPFPTSKVSEDHCWLSLDGSGSREASCEVTTVSAAQRAQRVEPDAWAGWLYSGGQGAVLTAQQTLAAMLVSVDPSTRPARGKRASSHEHKSARLERVQRELLMCARRTAPTSFYPAAKLAIAALVQVWAGCAKVVEQLLLLRSVTFYTVTCTRSSTLPLCTQSENERLLRDRLAGHDSDAFWSDEVAATIVAGPLENWRSVGRDLFEDAVLGIAERPRGAGPNQAAEMAAMDASVEDTRNEIGISEPATLSPLQTKRLPALWYPASTYASVLFGQAEWMADNLNPLQQEALGHRAAELFSAGLRQLDTCQQVLGRYRFAAHGECHQLACALREAHPELRGLFW